MSLKTRYRPAGTDAGPSVQRPALKMRSIQSSPLTPAKRPSKTSNRVLIFSTAYLPRPRRLHSRSAKPYADPPPVGDNGGPAGSNVGERAPSGYCRRGRPHGTVSPGGGRGGLGEGENVPVTGQRVVRRALGRRLTLLRAANGK